MLSRTFASTLALGHISLVLAADFYPITGFSYAQSQDMDPPMRRNINDLHAEAGPQWDLYILALADMKNAPLADPLSYFQIASIHGDPPYEWNNTGSRNNNGWPGYCPHSEAIFLPWHRPYILLYEQSLVTRARSIASQYPGQDRARYLQAAETLRTPYWDWADIPEVPNSTIPATLTINTPRGRQAINNPLATYIWPREAFSGSFGQFEPPRPWSNTIRCPSPMRYPESANQRLRRNNLKELVYDAFIYSETFEAFSTTAMSGSSIEQAHNLVHNSGACGQTFSDLKYASYDPLFWLHHTNVDRLYALWQAAHPEKDRLTQSYPGNSRFTTPEGTRIGPDSPLQPFHGFGNEVHTSNTVISTYDFGYTYQDLDIYVDTGRGQFQNQNRKRDGYGGGPPANTTYTPPSTTGYHYSYHTQWSYPPTPVPPSPDEVRKKRAIGTIHKLYSSPAHKKERDVYLAHIDYQAEDLPQRPAIIDVYLCDMYVGNIVALQEPKKGHICATVPLNDAVEECKKRGIDPESYGNGVSVEINTPAFVFLVQLKLQLSS
ncbi:hypothetical protein HIM_05272 [Hirsutella minnesotensis 3608]|uniref:Tyrosinase copper-binding domain-containing protein n=1 Tax=Hirsutella minnesotensis 3608 TaxID=1043627 RepID=A0A0F7ZKL0_9HYPO|nr:hypothetical protein HIM_05272 [Hirsutella minnesotensis 3608]